MKSILFLFVIVLNILNASPQNIALTKAKNREEWAKQKEFFDQNGYLWIKNFFSSEQVLLIQNWADEINETAEKILQLEKAMNTSKIPGMLLVISEAANPNQVCRTEDMLSFYPDLYHFVEGNISTYLGKLLEEPYVLFKDKLNFKWPGGGAFSPHQDFPAFEFLGPREHITAMVCIDPANLENGCLQVANEWMKTFEEDFEKEVLQSGKAVIPYIVGGKDHGSIRPEYVEKIEWLPLNTDPGDLVIFNSYLPHFSEPNRSEESRRAMFFTLNRLQEGDFRKTYYHTKRSDPENPMFHFGTPTKARSK